MDHSTCAVRKGSASMSGFAFCQMAFLTSNKAQSTKSREHECSQRHTHYHVTSLNFVYSFFKHLTEKEMLSLTGVLLGERGH